MAIGVDSARAEAPTVARLAVAVVSTLAIGTVTWAVLRTRRQRREYEAELTAWAAERAQRDERLRIARELHDLASHGLGLITVRAAAARITTGSRAAEEREHALADIEQAGRSATHELRRMLAVLRAPHSVEIAPLHPQLSFAELPALITDAERSGLRIELQLSPKAAAPEASGIDAATQATVSAILREALSNCARHSGPGPVRVRIDLEHAEGSAELVLRVSDAGRFAGWTPQPGAGRGIIGMRERAAMLGGTLHTERNGTGFHVEARMPLEGMR